MNYAETSNLNLAFKSLITLCVLLIVGKLCGCFSGGGNKNKSTQTSPIKNGTINVKYRTPPPTKVTSPPPTEKAVLEAP